MSFYIYTFIFALVQTFLLLPIFSGYLYVPDFVTVAILYTSLRSLHTDLKKILVPAFTLDLLYDSIGLNLSSKLLVFFVVRAFKDQYIIATRGSLILLSVTVFLVEHIFRYLLFRVKYYYPFEPLNLLLCLTLQTVAIMLVGKHIIAQDEQT